MRHFIILGTLFCLLLLTSGQGPENHPQPMPVPNEITLTILYDNYPYDPGFRASWGFACLIEGLEKTILFDSGGKDGNLMYNFEAAGKSPEDVDLIVLSHIHWDHTGGLPEFLESHTGIEVYIPASFPDEYRQKITGLGARPIDVTAPLQIIDQVWTCGEMGQGIIEQSLVISTSKGSIVITGCAHPGIEEIIDKAGELKVEKTLLVMGGFHLLRTGEKAVREIAETFKSDQIRYVAPTHCSGNETKEIFEETFGRNFLTLGAGRVIRLAEL